MNDSLVNSDYYCDRITAALMGKYSTQVEGSFIEESLMLHLTKASDCYYGNLLQYVESRGNYWHASRREVAIKGVAFPRNKIPNVWLNVLGEEEYLSELRKLVSQLDSEEDL